MDCVLHLTKCPETSSVVSTKIARYLSELLGLPLVDRAGMVANYENVLFVNSMSAFCDFLPEVAEIIGRCKRMVWCQNDYTVYPPTQVRKIYRDDLLVDRWSTIPQLPEEWSKLKIWTKVPMKATRYVNWNLLTYDPLPFKDPTEKGIFYYGAYRLDREHLFQKYFEFKKLYPISISASNKAMKKFLELNMLIDDLKTFKRLVPEMQQFATTLYLEDADSNEIYCSPANRFYECLSAGVAMLFDVSSVNTMEVAGYDVRPFVVERVADVENAMKNWKDIRNRQRILWADNYREQLEGMILEAYRGL